jgi:hypothetical protein
MTPRQLEEVVKDGAKALARDAGRPELILQQDIDGARAVVLSCLFKNLPAPHSHESWSMFAFMAATVISYRFLTVPMRPEDALNDKFLQQTIQKIAEQVLLEVHQ